jgi:hypothetical protein
MLTPEENGAPISQGLTRELVAGARRLGRRLCTAAAGGYNQLQQTRRHPPEKNNAVTRVRPDPRFLRNHPVYETAATRWYSALPGERRESVPVSVRVPRLPAVSVHALEHASAAVEGFLSHWRFSDAEQSPPRKRAMATTTGRHQLAGAHQPGTTPGGFQLGRGA